MSREKKPKSPKKILIIWLAVFFAAGAASFILLRFPDLFDRDAGDVAVTGSGGFYDWFYEADYSLALSDYEDYDEYLGLDRALYYKIGNQTVGISKEELSNYPEQIRFFGKYFDTVIHGDSKTYNTLFTSVYYDTHEEKERFTPQMVYDMMIEQLSVKSDDLVNEYVFDVSYKIFENNGTFRDDIYSDASRTQRITVDDSEGEFKISSVQYYVAN